MANRETLQTFSHASADTQSITIRVFSEDVRLERGSDGDQIVVTQQGSRNTKELVDVQMDGSQLLIRSPERFGLPVPIFTRSSQIHVRIPTLWNGSITARSASGDVTLTGLHVQNAKLDSKSGDVVATDVTCEDFAASAVSGDVRVENLRCDNCKSESKSGDVTIAARAEKEIRLRSISGDVHLEGRAPDVTCLSTSGDATAVLESVQRVQGSTKSGDADIEIRSASGLEHVECTSVSGDVKLNIPERTVIDFAFSSVSGSLNTKHAQGLVLDSSGIPIRMNTVSGDGILRTMPNTGARTATVLIKHQKAASGEMMGNVDYV